MKQAFLVLFLSVIFVIAMQGQYVTIEGRQFKDGNGENFYPMVCNYIADIIHDTSDSDTIYHVSSSGAYGFRWGYDYDSFDSCYYPGIRNDFTEIHNMGFNAIRLMGPVPEKDTLLEYGFNVYSSYWHNPEIDKQVKKVLSAPYGSDPNMAFYLEMLNDIVATADSCNLKVILVPSRGMLAQSNNGVVADVAGYLACFAAHFAGNPAVMAYDLFNEPTWVDVWKNHPEVDHNKYQICRIVTQWFDSINAHDSNHLVTIGLSTYNDLLEWDPGVMKVDFVSEHIYPTFSSPDTFSLNSAINRFRDELIWTGRNIPLPWIIGEFGFAGTDNAFPPFNVPPFTDSLYTHQPYVWGTTAEQFAFVDTALELMRDCGASGISWWQFQDIYWGQNPLVTMPNAYKEGFFGLLNSGRWNSDSGFTTFRKPAVSLFQAFDPEEPPGSFPQQSSLFYNPYNFDSTDVNTRIGFVIDTENGTPLKDATVLLWSLVRHHLSFDSAKYITLVPHHTYTNNMGCYNAYPAPDDIRPTTIDDLRISYPGFQRVERGWNSAYNPDTIPIFQDSTFFLENAMLAYDEVVDDTVISIGTYAEFHGWNSVAFTGTKVQSGGHCEAVARQEIVVQSEFEADTGSEVYLYTDEIFPECNDFSSYLKPVIIAESPGLSLNNLIELQFKPETSELEFVLFPNPTGGTVTCRVTETEQELFTLSIVDVFGRRHIESKITKPEISIDLSMLAKGVYFASLSNSNVQWTKKLIIQ